MCTSTKVVYEVIHFIDLLYYLIFWLSTPNHYFFNVFLFSKFAQKKRVTRLLLSSLNYWIDKRKRTHVRFNNSFLDISFLFLHYTLYFLGNLHFLIFLAEFLFQSIFLLNLPLLPTSYKRQISLMQE